MAGKGKKAKPKIRRRGKRELTCGTERKFANFNPMTGKKFKTPMCVLIHGEGKPTKPHVLPKPKIVPIDCRKGETLYQANPNTGTKRPTCVRTLKNGKVKTHSPRIGPKSRAQGVKIQKIVAVAGRR